MIPGSNLLLQAGRLIRFSPIDYYAFDSRSINAARQWVATFTRIPDVYASVQAVQRNSYVQYGLDLQKNYVKVYAARNIIDLARDSSGDRFIYDGRLFQLESQYTWFKEDGWDKCIAVDIGAPVNGGPGA